MARKSRWAFFAFSSLNADWIYWPQLILYFIAGALLAVYLYLQAQAIM